MGRAADVQQLLLQVDASVALAQRNLRALSQSVNQETGKIEQSLERVEQAHTRMGKAFNDNGRLRGGLQQLSFQVGDVSQQMALGTKASTIFVQQSGQVIQALQLMGGEGNKFLQFLGGPWGIVLSTATVILATLGGKLLDNKGAVGGLVDKMREQADQAAKNREADELWKHTIEGLTEAIRKRREEQEKSLQTDIQGEQASLKGAQDELAGLIRRRDQLQRDIADKIAANHLRSDGKGGINPGNIIEEPERQVLAMQKQLAGLSASIKAAEANVRGALAPIAERNVEDKLDKAKAATDDYTRALGRLREQLRAGAIDQAKFELELGKAAATRDAAIKAAQTDKSSGLSRVTLGEVSSLLKDQFGGTITSTTGGKHVKNSYHYAGQAVDFVPTGGMHSISKADIQAAADAAGIKLLELLGPGDKGHDDHFHVAFAKGRLGPDQVAKLQAGRSRSADSEAARQVRNDNGFEESLARLNAELLQSKMELLDDARAQASAAGDQVRLEQRSPSTRRSLRTSPAMPRPAGSPAHGRADDGRDKGRDPRGAPARAARLMVQVIHGAFASPPPQPPLKLPKREQLPPEAEQLSGPYGPRFIGYGPTPKQPLWWRLAPHAIGSPAAWRRSPGL
jgi:hypothetical protein